MKKTVEIPKNKIKEEDMEFIQEHGYCPCCYRHAEAKWLTLNPSLIGTLQKIYGAIVLKGENDIHLGKDTEDTEFELTYGQRSSITMLRHHGLVFKIRNAQKKQVPGHWGITKRGAGFLRGGLKVPLKVRTFDNRVTDHSPEMIDFRGVMRSDPKGLPIVDFLEYEIATPTELTQRAEQATMFDLPPATAQQHQPNRGYRGAH